MKRRDFTIVLIAIVVAWTPFFLGVWDKTKPVAGRKARYIDDDVRANNAALETAFDAAHDFTTGSTQTGAHDVNCITSFAIADGTVDACDIAADVIDETKIADNGIDSEHYNDGSIDTAHIADNQITAGKIEDDITFDQFPSTPSAAPDADYEVANKKYVDDQDTTYITAAGTFQYDGTQVYNTNCPTTFTDLDLSSYCGSNRALVFLKVKNIGTGVTFHFRTNGDTEDVGYGDDLGGTSSCRLDQNHIGTIVVMTDTSGIIEWKGQAQKDTDIWLLGYIK